MCLGHREAHLLHNSTGSSSTLGSRMHRSCLQGVGMEVAEHIMGCLPPTEAKQWLPLILLSNCGNLSVYHQTPLLWGLPLRSLRPGCLWPNAMGLASPSIPRAHTSRNQGLRGSLSYRTPAIRVVFLHAMIHPLGNSSVIHSLRKYN